jgi:hypothetical protein
LPAEIAVPLKFADSLLVVSALAAIQTDSKATSRITVRLRDGPSAERSMYEPRNIGALAPQLRLSAEDVYFKDFLAHSAADCRSQFVIVMAQTPPFKT